MDDLTGKDVWSLIAPILAPYNDPVMTSAYIITFCALKEYDEGRNVDGMDSHKNKADN